MSEWQPIETAPKDGTRLLLWCSDLHWDEGTRVPVGVRFGRVYDSTVYGDSMNGDWTFTHWMPLPKPPVQL